MVNVNNILGGITKNAGKIGGLLGFLTGSPGGFSDVESIVQNILGGNIHAPDIQATFRAIANEPFVKTGVLTWVAGMVLEAVPIGGAKKFAKPLQKFGINYAIGSVAQKILWMSTHASQGSDSHLKTMFNRSVRNPNRAEINPYLVYS